MYSTRDSITSTYIDSNIKSDFFFFKLNNFFYIKDELYSAIVDIKYGNINIDIIITKKKIIINKLISIYVRMTVKYWNFHLDIKTNDNITPTNRPYLYLQHKN